MKLNPKLFIPSGLNSQFNGDGLEFKDYIAQTQHMIAHARIDITQDNANTIVQANSPFELIPEQYLHNSSKAPIKRGILMIHGLFDSCFRSMDMARSLLKQGFLVRSILLPGHGTVPGDLLNLPYQEWIKAVDYGVESLSTVVDEIYIVGHSLGATLAIHKAIRDPRIHKLILTAPALKLRQENLVRLAFLLKLSNKTRWWKRIENDYAKYNSIPADAAEEAYKLIRETLALNAHNPLSIPLFIVLTDDDETVVTEATKKFFAQHPCSNSRMLLYSRTPFISKDDRIERRDSRFPDQKILDFSHTCLTTSPGNPHYGAHGDYQDFSHYPHAKPPFNKEIFLGSIRKGNLIHHVIQRLGYNPDFEYMMQRINTFLGT